MFATVISLLPFDLNEEKPGLNPSEFKIPAAKKDGMSLLHVNEAWFSVYIDKDRGSIRVPVPAHRLAESIVFDSKVSKPFGVVLGEAEPGLFWVDGKLTEKEVETKHKDLLNHNREMQKRWFQNLVAEADDWWNKFHSHRMIPDTHRLAAKMLGLDREWNIQTTVENMQNCPACTTIIPTKAIVCPSCRVVLDKEKYKQFTFAEV